MAVRRTLILAGWLDRAAEIEPAWCKPVHNLPKLPSIRITETTSFTRCLSPSFTTTYTFIRPPYKALGDICLRLFPLLWRSVLDD